MLVSALYEKVNRHSLSEQLLSTANPSTRLKKKKKKKKKSVLVRYGSKHQSCWPVRPGGDLGTGGWGGGRGEGSQAQHKVKSVGFISSHTLQLV